VSRNLVRINLPPTFCAGGWASACPKSSCTEPGHCRSVSLLESSKCKRREMGRPVVAIFDRSSLFVGEYYRG
jgi:hypothetical protein